MDAENKVNGDAGEEFSAEELAPYADETSPVYNATILAWAIRIVLCYRGSVTDFCRFTHLNRRTVYFRLHRQKRAEQLSEGTLDKWLRDLASFRAEKGRGHGQPVAA